MMRRIWHLSVILMLIGTCFFTMTIPKCTMYGDSIDSTWDPISTTSREISFSEMKDIDFSAGTLDNVRIKEAPYETRLELARTGPQAMQVNSNTTGLWHFDEGSGTDVTDSSSYDNHGTLQMGMEGNTNPSDAWVTGRFGFGIEFDGVDDRVYMPGNQSLALVEDFTLEAWIKPNELPNFQYVLSKRSGYYMGTYNKRVRFTIDSPQGVINCGTYGEPISLNEWFHIAGSYDGSDMKVYVDGELLGVTQNHLGTEDDVATFQFGILNTIYPFNGTIDEARVLDTVLSDEQIGIDALGPCYSSGEFTSSPIDLEENSILKSISWGASIDPDTDLKFQLRTSNSPSDLASQEFIGPDGTSGTYYTTFSDTFIGHVGERWVQYRAYFSTTNPSRTPRLYNVTLSYNRLPDVSIITPSDEQFGNINIFYQLMDQESHKISILPEYSTDLMNFFPASMGFGSDGMTWLTSSPQGKSHLFVWDSKKDLDGLDVSSVYFRLTPSDTDGGVSKISDPFHVDNNVPPEGVKLIGPTNNTYVEKIKPEFSWEEAQDAEEDVVSYEILIDEYDDYWGIPVVTTLTSKDDQVWSPTDDLIDNVSYKWRVRAKDNDYGPWSAVFYFIIDNDIPTANVPKDFGEYNNTGTIKWQWEPTKDTGSGILGYYVSIGTGLDKSDVISDYFILDPWYELVEAKDSLKYYCRIKVQNGVGSISDFGESSDGILIDLDKPIVGNPLHPDDYTNSSTIVWTWDPTPDTGSGILGYHVSICTGTSSVKMILSTFTENTSYEYENVFHGDTYHCKIRAENGARTIGDYSDLSSGVHVDRIPPFAPSGLKAIPDESRTSLNITWNASQADDLVGYKLYFSSDGINFHLKKEFTAQTTSYLDTGLRKDTTYYYRISAYDRVPNESPMSESVTGIISSQNNTPKTNDTTSDDASWIPFISVIVVTLLIMMVAYLVIQKRRARKPPLPPPGVGAQPPPQRQMDSSISQVERPPPYQLHDKWLYQDPPGYSQPQSFNPAQYPTQPVYQEPPLKPDDPYLPKY